MRSLTGRQRTWRVSRDVKDPLALPILPALLLSVPSGTRGTTTGHSKKPENFNSIPVSRESVTEWIHSAGMKC